MKAYQASLINAILLILMSAWGFFTSETPSYTALIPTFVGGVLLFCNRGVRQENKVIAHVAVLLTVVILFGLIKPLMGALSREDSIALVRVGVMLVSTVLALVFFVRSFIQARKAREASDE